MKTRYLLVVLAFIMIAIVACKKTPERIIEGRLTVLSGEISKMCIDSTSGVDNVVDFYTIDENNQIIKTNNLTIFYPNFKEIDFVVDRMPSGEDGVGVFCCAAAFTGKLLSKFDHSNIAGNHVSDGVYYQGYSCKQNTGAFVYYKGKWKFSIGNYNNWLKEAASNNGMGFGQAMIIYESEPLDLWRTGKNYYRALCEKDNRLCVIESNNVIEYNTFVDYLKEYGVKFALYLDMGSGWNYAWYRDNQGTVKYLHTKSHLYATNWIVFY